MLDCMVPFYGSGLKALGTYQLSHTATKFCSVDSISPSFGDASTVETEAASGSSVSVAGGKVSISLCGARCVQLFSLH